MNKSGTTQQKKRKKLRKLINKMTSHEKELNEYPRNGVVSLKEWKLKDNKAQRAKKRYIRFLQKSSEGKGKHTSHNSV